MSGRDDDGVPPWVSQFLTEKQILRNYTKNPELSLNHILAMVEITTAKDGATPSKVAEENGWDSAQTSKVLRFLRDEEYVIQIADQKDGRVKKYHATAKGARATKAHMESIGYDVSKIEFYYASPKKTDIRET